MVRSYAFIWLLVLCSTAYIYLLNEGGALGQSIMLPFLEYNTQKKVLAFLSHVWDANQTWLVFSLAGLYGGFSQGFSTIMTLGYLPIILLLLALMWRGAAIEYTMKGNHKIWLLVLALSSFAIIVLQGYLIAIFTYKALPAHAETYASLNFLGIIIGILLLVVFDILLGINQLPMLRALPTQRILLLLFSISFIVLVITYAPLKLAFFHSHYKLLAWTGELFGLFLLLMTHRAKPKLYLYLLAVFVAINMIIVGGYLYPNFFPGHMNYIKVASDEVTLKWMTVISAIMLPSLFIVLLLFRQHYKKQIFYFNIEY